MSDIPAHVAIVMDGNGRWAARRMLPRVAGHKRGMDALRNCLRHCLSRGVSELTVFAFSSENWSRPADEVSGLMDLMANGLVREVPELCERGVRIRFVGDRTRLSEKVLKGLALAENDTAKNTHLAFHVCFNYGGRWDIVQAAQRLAASGHAFTEANFSQHLATSPGRDPDLIIRTGGELRLSNFLLWQASYAELFFSDKLWPDFDEAALDAALAAYANRQRRYGKTPEQASGGQADG